MAIARNAQRMTVSAASVRTMAAIRLFIMVSPHDAPQRRGVRRRYGGTVAVDAGHGAVITSHHCDVSDGDGGARFRHRYFRADSAQRLGNTLAPGLLARRLLPMTYEARRLADSFQAPSQAWSRPRESRRRGVARPRSGATGCRVY